MKEHDWVCENCFAQNTLSDSQCRVCGKPAPPKISVINTERDGMDRHSSGEEAMAESRQVAVCPRLPDKTSGFKSIIKRHGLSFVWLVLALQIVCICIFDTSLPGLLAGDGKLLWNPEYFHSLPRSFSSLFQRGIMGMQSLKMDFFRLSVPYAYRSIAFDPEGSLWSHIVVMLATEGGLRIAISIIWTFRLLLRCLRTAGRDIKTSGYSFLLYMGEAIVFNIAYYAIRLSCVKGFSLAGQAQKMMASSFGMDIVGMLCVIVVLMLIECLRPEYCTEEPYTGMYRMRLFRKDLIWGFVSLAILIVLFLFIVCAASIH